VTIRNVAVFFGILAVPGWYVYRSVSEHSRSPLRWNELFLSPNTITDRRVAEARESAKQEIEAFEKQHSDEVLRNQAAGEIRRCIDLVDETAAVYAALLNEAKLWEVQIVPLLHSERGAAVRTRDEWVRTFRDLYRYPPTTNALAPRMAKVYALRKLCEEAGKTPQTEFKLGYERGEVLLERGLLQTETNQLEDARVKILCLVQIAREEVPDNLEGALLKQQVADAVEKNRRPY
jgi:hypothetical protein